MTDRDHHELLDAVRACQGKVMVSTYPNDIYDSRLKDWNYEDRQPDNKASSSRDKPERKTERVWMNF